MHKKVVPHTAPDRDKARAGSRRLLASIILNLAISIAEVVGGLLSGSLALLSDAVHNLSDTASQVVSYGAMRLGRRGADNYRTFGYRRVEVLAAFFNLVTLFVVTLLIAKEGLQRLADPTPIDGQLMLLIAVVGLVGNIGSALLLRSDARTSLNVRSAYLHIVTDAVSSVAVTLGAVLYVSSGFATIDPIVTLLIAGYILYHGYGTLRETGLILMNSVPADIKLEDVKAAVTAIDRVEDVHHMHIWMMDEDAATLEAHVVIDTAHVLEIDDIKKSIKSMLETRFGIRHSTLEFEIEDCDSPGHGRSALRPAAHS